MTNQEIAAQLSSLRGRLLASPSGILQTDLDAVSAAIKILGTGQVAQPQPPPNRRRCALVIGTNYITDPARLRGCVEDVTRWRSLLQSSQYQVETLLGSNASNNKIAAAIAKAVAIPDADIVIQFSGHGTQIPDRDGDEPDHRDEAICPDDFRRVGVIRDDELHSLFAKLADGSRLLVILDCCHSGTGTRGSDSLPRFVPWDESIPRPIFSREQFGDFDRVATLAACRDNQTAGDQPSGGMFTQALLASLTQAIGLGVTVKEWLEMAGRRISHVQNPQHSGPDWPVKEFFS